MVLVLSVPSIVPDISEVSVVAVEYDETEGSVESLKSVDPVGKVLINRERGVVSRQRRCAFHVVRQRQQIGL